MTSSYRPRLHARVPHWVPYSGVEALTVEALRTALAQTAIHRLVGSLDEGYELELGMRRDSHATALDEIAGGVARFGFLFSEAFISEWVSQVVRGAVVGALTAGGSAAMRRCAPSTTAAATSIGALAGGIAGSFVHEEVARFFARRDPYSGLWQVSPVPLPEPVLVRFGYA